MAYVIACLMAGMSFLINKILVKYIGIESVISWSPFLEETAKTLPAYWLGADIFVTHFFFGVLEGAYDWCSSSGDGVRAAVFSISGHSLFGLLTLGLLAATGSIAISLAGGVTAHMAWNVAVVRYFS